MVVQEGRVTDQSGSVMNPKPLWISGVSAREVTLQRVPPWRAGAQAQVDHACVRLRRFGALSVGQRSLEEERCKSWPKQVRSVRRQNIWRNVRRKLAERWPRLGVDIRRRACGAASADVRWSAV